MPGDFIEEVLIFQCGTRPDGTAIMCSEIGWAKVPFETLSENSPNVGWTPPDGTDIHIPLERLALALRKFGVELSYDKDALARRIGPPPTSDD
jgi:hypothetical protein